MKKTLVSILIGLFMVGVSGQAWAGNVVAADLNCTNPAGCVETNEISDGAVTEPKLAPAAVTNTKIADGAITEGKVSNGAITNAKISGTIAASKLEKPANVVVVAKSGGDFTSIQAAINSINPTAENPYLVKVMPGTYIENISINGGKSYLRLQGAGREVTFIKSPDHYTVIGIYNSSNIVVSGFTISDGYKGFHNNGTSPIISDNIITGNNFGIQNFNNASPTISSNIITDNEVGVWSSLQSSPLISQNKITGNITDIYVGEYSAPIINFNIIDSITTIDETSIWSGMYNVRSNGTSFP